MCTRPCPEGPGLAERSPAACAVPVRAAWRAARLPSRVAPGGERHACGPPGGPADACRARGIEALPSPRAGRRRADRRQQATPPQGGPALGGRRRGRGPPPPREERPRPGPSPALSLEDNRGDGSLHPPDRRTGHRRRGRRPTGRAHRGVGRPGCERRGADPAERECERGEQPERPGHPRAATVAAVLYDAVVLPDGLDLPGGFAGDAAPRFVRNAYRHGKPVGGYGLALAWPPSSFQGHGDPGAWRPERTRRHRPPTMARSPSPPTSRPSPRQRPHTATGPARSDGATRGRVRRWRAPRRCPRPAVIPAVRAVVVVVAAACPCAGPR